MKTGQRILVVFCLDGEAVSDANLRNSSNEGAMSRIIEDIGEVRHVTRIENGFSTAIELTGLHDSDIDILIRATNAASARANVKKEAESVLA